MARSFWKRNLKRASLVLIGRREEGEALFERLLALRNDLGLLSEEYDARSGHMRGNFPQALTHMALVNTARLLAIPVQQAKRSSAKGERPAAATGTMNRETIRVAATCDYAAVPSTTLEVTRRIRYQ